MQTQAFCFISTHLQTKLQRWGKKSFKIIDMLFHPKTSNLRRNTVIIQVIRNWGEKVAQYNKCL